MWGSGDLGQKTCKLRSAPKGLGSFTDLLLLHK